MSQGTQVKWDGGALGFVTSWEFTPGVAETMDATDYSAALGGLGAEARVWKMLNCTAITPGTASVSVVLPAAESEIAAHCPLKRQGARCLSWGTPSSPNERRPPRSAS